MTCFQADALLRQRWGEVCRQIEALESLIISNVPAEMTCYRPLRGAVDDLGCAMGEALEKDRTRLLSDLP